MRGGVESAAGPDRAHDQRVFFLGTYLKCLGWELKMLGWFKNFRLGNLDFDRCF